jgi:hypothetical protein
MDLATCGDVRVLEARFHPKSKAGREVVIVGRIICEGARASIEPAEVSPRALKPFDSVRLLEKLRFLLATTADDPFKELPRLRSDFWSFHEVSRSGNREAP